MTNDHDICDEKELSTAVDLHEYVEHQHQQDENETNDIKEDRVQESAVPEHSVQDADAGIPLGKEADVSATDESEEESNLFVRGQRSSVVTTREHIGHVQKSVVSTANSLHNLEQSIPFYAPPIQRQQWGEPQVLPHINWGDLFFDLFYVGAAYNLGSFLISVVDDGTHNVWPRGLLYYVGMFGSLILVWSKKMSYDSKFTVVDYSHRLVETIRVCFLALSVMHIEGIEVMQNPLKVNTFNFMLGLTLEQLATLCLHVEIFFKGRGSAALRIEAKRALLIQHLPQLCIYFAALVVAGVAHFSPNVDYDKKMRHLAAADSEYAQVKTHSFTSADVPYLIIFLGCVCTQTLLVLYITCLLPGGGKHKSFATPMNVDFAIHRYGEWTMLMLGESVLSLLIVETVETTDYYVVAFVGIVTVILLQALHFESEPSHADGHAMRRSKSAGIFFYYTIQIYSMALVAVGASYKVMLQVVYYTYNKKSGYEASSYEGDSPYDNDYNSSSANNTSASPDKHHRLLLGRRLAGSAIDDSPEIKQITANLFAVALMISLISLEFMTFSHQGFHRNFDRCNAAGDSNHKWRRCICWAYVLCKVACIVITGTLSLWIVEPHSIVVAGMILVLLVIIVRVAGWELFNNQKGYCSAQAGRCHLKKKSNNNADEGPEAHA